MRDCDQNPFQPQQTHDVSNGTVAEQVDAENIASQLHNKNIHIMNKGEQTNKEKLKNGANKQRKEAERQKLYEED